LKTKKRRQSKSAAFFIDMYRLFQIASLVCFLLADGSVHDLAATEKDADLLGLVENGGYAVERDGRILLQHNLDRQFVPASILKIATSLTALHILGPEYRFETRFYLDEHNDLFIQGSGDPFLVSEEIRHILARLKTEGSINNIRLDDSAFALNSKADGSSGSDNPYDAMNSALAVNFNTVNISVSDRGVVSAEPQTPTLPIMIELAAGLPTGVHRLNITRDYEDERILRHTGELFRALQRELGIPGTGSIQSMKVPAHLKPVYVHRSSKKLLDIISELMRFSNNFIANQLFLTCGVQKYGLPATWEKGRAALRDYLGKELHLSEKDVVVVEGSGLSRGNRISVWAMLEVLSFFKPYIAMLPEKNGMLVKSGTLSGVFAYAGYFQGADRQDAFVIMLNQRQNTRDRLLGILKERYLNLDNR